MDGDGYRGLAGAVAVVVTSIGVLLWGWMLKGPFDLVDGLLRARTHLDGVQQQLRSGTIKLAAEEAYFASAAATRSSNALDGPQPVLDIVRAVPRIGAALGEVPHLVAAAEHSSTAARKTLEITVGALRGPDPIVDKRRGEARSRIKLERIADMEETIAGTRRDVAAAGRALDAVDRSRLPRRLRPAVGRGIHRARQIDEVLADLEAGMEVLPELLGADGRRNYLLAMQNPAELRGTGGAILRFAMIAVNDGRARLLKPRTVYKVDENRETIDIPLPSDAWYVRNIEDARRFGNSNWSPDWPLSARLFVRYGRATDPGLPRIDGVIAVDPTALRKLLPGVGGLKVRGRDMTQDDVVRFLLYDAYAQYPTIGQRRIVLNRVVDKFYRKLLRLPHPTKLLRGMGSALAEKHIQIWLADGDAQSFIERMDWDAAIETGRQRDYFSVVEQNVGGNKLNYVERQQHRLDVRIDARDAAVSAEIEIDNEVELPVPRYWEGDSEGFHRPMVNLYVPGRAELREARVVAGDRLDPAAGGTAAWTDGRPPAYTERGKRVWPVVLEIPPRRTGQVRFDYRVPGVVMRRNGRNVYRLQVQHQPKVHHERLTIRVRLPDGADDVRARGWETDGDVLVWDRRLRSDVLLEVSWR